MAGILTKTDNSDFQKVLEIISSRRARASRVVNNEVLLCAWEVGGFVSQRIEDSAWGSKTVTELSEYLRTQNPTLRGYGRSNIYNMVELYNNYSSSEFEIYADRFKLNKRRESIVQLETGQLSAVEIVQQPVGQLVPSASIEMPEFLMLTTYSNHIEILNRCKSIEERVFYVIYAWKEHLNRNELLRCIKTDTFSALAGNKSLSKGMAATYPTADILFKDEIFVDFLGLPQKHSEKRLKTGILDNMKAFILELGKEDFIFIDKEYPINVGGSMFKIDLLFFHRILQCLVAIELKSGDFKPKDIGQLEFYLEALDRDVKKTNENPSIGILLCRSANRSIVEYAMSRSMSPTMVAKYKRKLVPKEVLQKTLDEFGDFFLA